MIFYTVAAVVCIVGFTADMILRYMMKIPSFGMEGRLHNIKGKLIPIEDFIPHNLTMLFVFGAALGIFGIFMKLLDINGLIAFPCSVMFGCGVNFLVMHIIKPFFTAISGDILSEKTDISVIGVVFLGLSSYNKNVIIIHKNSNKSVKEYVYGTIDFESTAKLEEFSLP